MPAFAFIKADTTEETIDELINRIAWLTSKLDSRNVKRLDTNETTIKSENGETYINGPIIEQYDSSGTLRIKQGLDTSTNKFLFNMYDAAGNLTINLNASGEAVFGGNIETLKDAQVGYNLYIGEWGDNLTQRSIYFASDNFDTKIEWYDDLSLDSGDLSDMGLGSLTFTDGIKISTDNIYIDYGEAALLKGDGIKFELFNNFYVDADEVVMNNNALGFFGVTPASAQSVPSLSTPTVSAGTDSVDLTSLNDAVSTITSKLNSLINALDNYGLV
jgi:hypothetical protein